MLSRYLHGACCYGHRIQFPRNLVRQMVIEVASEHIDWMMTTFGPQSLEVCQSYSPLHLLRQLLRWSVRRIEWRCNVRELNPDVRLQA
jgi:hypothetical protein